MMMEIDVGVPCLFMVENFYFIFDGNVISRRKRPGCLSRKEGDYSGNNSSHARKQRQQPTEQPEKPTGSTNKNNETHKKV